MGDRRAHVGRRHARGHRSVGEGDQAVDDRLGVDDDLEPIGRHSKKMMRFDQLQPFVHEARRIDRHFRAHHPIGMGERLVARRGADAVGAPFAERAAGGGHGHPDDLGGVAPPIAWKMALCSESTGRMRAPERRAASMTASPRRPASPCWPARPCVRRRPPHRSTRGPLCQRWRRRPVRPRAAPPRRRPRRQPRPRHRTPPRPPSARDSPPDRRSRQSAPAARPRCRQAAPSRRPPPRSPQKRPGAPAMHLDAGTANRARRAKNRQAARRAPLRPRRPGGLARWNWLSLPAAMPSPLEQSARDEIALRVRGSDKSGENRRGDESVQPIHQASVAGNEAAGILDAEPSLERGFEEIAPCGDSAVARPNQKSGETVRPGDEQARGRPRRARHDRARPGLARRDARPKLRSADEPAAEIGHDVGAPDHRKKPENRRQPELGLPGGARGSRQALPRRAAPGAAQTRPRPRAIQPTATAPRTRAADRAGTDLCRAESDASASASPPAATRPAAGRADHPLPFPKHDDGGDQPEGGEDQAANPGRRERDESPAPWPQPREAADPGQIAARPRAPTERRVPAGYGHAHDLMRPT